MAKKLQIKKGTFIGDSFLGSPIIYNIADTSLLSVGDVVAHADGLQVESKILSIDSATQITLDKNAVATHAGTTFTSLIDNIIVDTSTKLNGYIEDVDSIANTLVLRDTNKSINVNDVVFDDSVYSTTLSSSTLSSDVTILLPDTTGTLALTADIPDIYNNQISFTAGSGLTIESVASSFTLNQNTDSTITLGHSNTITAGSTSNNGNITLAYNETFKVPTLVYDANGHITGVSYDSLTLPTAGGYTHDTFTYSTSADTETLLTSIPLITKLSVNNEGHVSASEYRKLVAGDYVNITATADGNITISADSEPYVAGTGLTLDGQIFNHSNSITAGTVSGSSGGTSFGGTVNIPSITYDAQGHITATGTTSITLPANIDTYLSSITWNNGTTSGPTGTATLNDSSTVSIPAIPSASISQSGIVTTGSQSFNGDKTFDDNVIINKNLTVHGTMTTKDTQQVNIGDNIVLLNAEEAGAPSENAGIEVERGTSTNVSLLWNESSDRWNFTNDGTTYYNIPLPTEYNNYVHDTFTGDDFSIDTGPLTGATVISDLNINLTTNTEGHVTDANATVATRNLTLADLGWTAPGNGQLTLAVSGIGLSGSAIFTANQSTGSTFTVTSNATTAATADTIVARDSSGDVRSNSRFYYNNNAYTEYNSTDKSIDFVFTD
jgi:hypothetical protein